MYFGTKRKDKKKAMGGLCRRGPTRMVNGESVLVGGCV